MLWHTLFIFIPQVLQNTVYPTCRELGLDISSTQSYERSPIPKELCAVFSNHSDRTFLQRYDLDSDTWGTVRHIAGLEYDSTLAVINDCLYFADLDDSLIQRINVRSGERGTMSPIRDLAGWAAVHFENNIFLFGGYEDVDEELEIESIVQR